MIDPINLKISFVSFVYAETEKTLTRLFWAFRNSEFSRDNFGVSRKWISVIVMLIENVLADLLKGEVKVIVLKSASHGDFPIRVFIASTAFNR